MSNNRLFGVYTDENDQTIDWFGVYTDENDQTID
jgi:hypothetical protein